MERVNILFIVKSINVEDPNSDWIDKCGRRVERVPLDDNGYIQFDDMRMDGNVSLIGGCQMLAEEFVDAARDAIRNRFDYEYTKVSTFSDALRSLQMPLDRYVAYKTDFVDEGMAERRFEIIVER